MGGGASGKGATDHFGGGAATAAAPLLCTMTVPVGYDVATNPRGDVRWQSCRSRVLYILLAIVAPPVSSDLSICSTYAEGWGLSRECAVSVYSIKMVGALPLPPKSGLATTQIRYRSVSYTHLTQPTKA